ncbi:MAG: hypothetical protein QOK42_1079 [Frankiaceae bacterium]|nr:hypothetical protein [Frankiaceae bacterium]MDX6223979.1 hypothetical protein [Frankiales bacterium]
MPAQHGHAMLVRSLRTHRPEWFSRPGIRMLEVGTTREAIVNQDSTRILAQLCHEHGWSFTTCDMDPVTAEKARTMFAEIGVDAEAVAAKGEDYIAGHRRAFDVVYLDAYDFDHGNHSETRQARYEEVLGERISQHACELMHLRAIQGLGRAGRRRCLVVIDDTWLATDENGDVHWVGKGPQAVPWAEAHGWDVLDVSMENRAVLLERVPMEERVRRRVHNAAGTVKWGLLRRYKKVKRALRGTPN